MKKKDIKMIKMPQTPYMVELNRQFVMSKTDAQKQEVMDKISEYVKKLGLLDNA